MTASCSPVHVFSAVVGARLPSETAWKEAYQADKECKLMFDIIKKPSMNRNDNLSKLHHVYRGPMRRNLIVIDRGMLVLLEAIASESVTRKLRIVPRDLRQIIFIASHSNPIGGHFGVNSTVVRIRLRFSGLGCSHT